MTPEDYGLDHTDQYRDQPGNDPEALLVNMDIDSGELTGLIELAPIDDQAPSEVQTTIVSQPFISETRATIIELTTQLAEREKQLNKLKVTLELAQRLCRGLRSPITESEIWQKLARASVIQLSLGALEQLLRQASHIIEGVDEPSAVVPVSEPVKELIPDSELTSQARNALTRAGIQTIQDLQMYTAHDLLQLRAVGLKILYQYQQLMTQRGLSIKGYDEMMGNIPLDELTPRPRTKPQPYNYNIESLQSLSHEEILSLELAAFSQRIQATNQLARHLTVLKRGLSKIGAARNRPVFVREVVELINNPRLSQSLEGAGPQARSILTEVFSTLGLLNPDALTDD
ncbi:hypothetical protein HY524_01655 [Candidatus Berkelbacteria bacterium]|nr:hypothetical protein [Candidatus Berkelbacteria bacterium]